MMLNAVQLIGRPGRDPEIRKTGSDNDMAWWTMAVQRDFKDKEGTRGTDWIDCVAFGAPARAVARNIKKGQLFGVEGQLRTRTYTAQDGSTRSATEVVVRQIHFLQPRGQVVRPDESGYCPDPDPGDDFTEVEDDELPF